MDGLTVTIVVPDEVIAMIAAQAAAQVQEQQPRTASPYMSVPEAAEYLRAKPQRVHDLLSARRLTRHKDGSRTLILRSELERYVQESR